MWTYKIFNNRKIKHYAIITDDISGIKLYILYKDLAHMTPKGGETIVKNITNKLNQ